VTDTPAPEPGEWNWDAVKEEFETWADVKDAFETCDDLKNNNRRVKDED